MTKILIGLVLVCLESLRTALQEMLKNARFSLSRETLQVVQQSRAATV